MSTKAANYKVIRPLGKFEAYSAAQNNLNLYQSVSNCAQYSVPSSLQSDEAALHAAFEHAVAQIVLELPTLRCGIVDDHTNAPYFVEIEELDIRNHIQWQVLDTKEEDYDTQLLRIIEHQNGVRWTQVDRMPPFRFHVISRPGYSRVEAMLCLHHVLGDGMSTMILHRHLLQALNHPLDLGPVFSNHILRSTESPVLPPIQDKDIKWTQSFAYLVKQLVHAFVPKWLKPPSRKAIPWASSKVSNGEVDMHMRLITLQPETVKKVLAACKTHTTTLTPLLHALILFSLSKRLSPDVAQCFMRNTPVTTRRYVQLPPGSSIDMNDTMGNFMCVFEETVSPQEVSNIRARMNPQKDASNVENQDAELYVWDHATRAREALVQRLKELPHNDIFGMFHYVTSWHKWFQSQDGKRREHAWRVSNLGSLAADTAAEGGAGWKRERHIYSQSATAAGPAFNACVAGVHGGSICIALTWQDKAVEPTLVEEVRQDLEDWLTHFGQTGSFGVSSFGPQ